MLTNESIIFDPVKWPGLSNFYVEMIQKDLEAHRTAEDRHELLLLMKKVEVRPIKSGEG